MQILQHLRDTKPLIHCITNYVTVNDVANVLLSLGASPVMADDEAEVKQMASIANAMLINIGTLNQRTINSMLKAAKKANKLSLPVVLDPVGVGATELRNETALRLLKEAKFTLIRANASEISFLAGQGGKTKGVDADDSELLKGLELNIQTAKILAKKQGCIVVSSGKIDIITDGKQTALCKNGHQMMSNITGSGCMQGAVLAAFLAISNDKFQAVVNGVSAFGICGEMAFEKTQAIDGANASFRTFFIDEFSKITDDKILLNGCIEILD
ncbi:hydroxyethylthiazole kinase [Campylobacter mucosalis]|uniref:hydroxyethylthiazole kinase n=1 Tax=Campylobacter mucosalis TaxID=202 RepID=UPI0014700568|nr:hydroxyethylthiazole kinase [Campylobacter mucosalis]